MPQTYVEGLGALRGGPSANPWPPPRRWRAPHNAAEETPGERPIPPPPRRRAPRAAKDMQGKRPIPPPCRQRAPRNAAEETPGERPIPPPCRWRARHAAAEERNPALSTDRDGTVERLVSLFLAGAITPQTYVNGLSPDRDPTYTGPHPTSPQAKEHPSPTHHGRGRRAATPAKDSPSSTQHGRAAPQAKDSPSSTPTALQAKDSPKLATVGVSPDSLDHCVIPARMADGCATRPPQWCGP